MSKDSRRSNPAMSLTHQFVIACALAGLAVQIMLWENGPVIADRLVQVIEISPDKNPQYYVQKEPDQP